MAKILSKKRRTLDVYKRTGAWMRLCRAVLVQMLGALSHVLTANELAKVRKALTLLSDACGAAESRMFRDHLDIGNEYFAAFHGSLSGTPDSELDAEIRGLAKGFADGFFM